MEIKNNFLKEILGNCYPEEELFAKDLQIISDNEVVVTFLFPAYKRAKKDIPYVSANQIVPAIIEGLFAVTGHYVKNSKDKPMGFIYEDLPRRMWNAIFREFDKMVFSQRILKENFVEMKFKIINVESIKDFDVLYFRFSGPVRGTAKCLVPK